MALVDVEQQWSERVENKLKKRWIKAATMNVVSYVHGEGQYQVSSPNEYVPVISRSDGSMSSIHKEFQYIVTRARQHNGMYMQRYPINGYSVRSCLSGLS